MKHSPTSYTAYFGYLNPNTYTVTIPVGERNRFHPDPEDRGQTTVFAPGRVSNAFQIGPVSKNLVWSLDRGTATAGMDTTVCPRLTLIPNPLDFGPVSGSKMLSVTLTNNETANVTINAITVTNTIGGNFSDAGSGSCPAPPFTLTTGQGCTIDVAFAPTTSGDQSGTLTIASNASPLPDPVLLTGIGDCSNSVSNLNDSGPGSLRQKVADADPGDTIGFCVTGDIVLTSGQIDIDKNLTLAGPGQSLLSISGNNRSRVFEIGSFTTVAINDVTLHHGKEDHGGGIRNWGILSLTRSTVRNNIADSDGGGLFNLGAVTLQSSTISDNTAMDDGGGLFNLGTVTLQSSTVSGNTAMDNGGGFFSQVQLKLQSSSVSSNTAMNDGGGIYSMNELILQQSTIDANTGEDGAGIYNMARADIENSTLANNTAHMAGIGGGIWNVGSLTLTASTVTGNSAGYGGGISSLSQVYIERSLIALNTAAIVGPDCSAISSSLFISRGYNLIGNNSDCNYTPRTGDQVGTAGSPLDPLLDLLQNNGGPTLTQALRSGSPAIDVIPLGNCGVSVDQRGIARPQGTSCDVGAVEVE